MAINFEKYGKLIHYICAKCDDVCLLGSTKLNKILWFIDRLAYLNWGETITGETYIKRQFGPVPLKILKMLDDIQQDGKLQIKQSTRLGFKKDDYISLKTPDISVFSAEEVSLFDDVIAQITENHTARSISELTHDEIWEMAEIGEEIPHSTIFVSRLKEIDENDVEWARHQIQPQGGT